MTTDDCHASTYSGARERFRSQCLLLGLDFHAHDRKSPGKTNVPLFTDVARFGGADSRRMLLVTTGLHGVEGYFGNAFLSLFLDELSSSNIDSKRCGITLVHALNPYGFNANSRCDANNVDLNRNFLLSGEEYSGFHPLYEELCEFLNPPDWPLSEWPGSFLIRALWRALYYGKTKLSTALAAGQYQYPNGLFYGGSGPSETHCFVEEQIDDWTGNATEITHVDIHTGLGRYGKLQLIVDDEISAAQISRFEQLLNRRIITPQSGQLKYVARGTLTRWIRKRYESRDCFSCCAEFGTFNAFSVLAALRERNAASTTLKSDDSSSAYTDVLTRMHRVFCPPSPHWRRLVRQEARRLIRSLLAWLSHA